VRDVLDELEGEDLVEGGVLERKRLLEVGEEGGAGAGAEVGDDDGFAGSADDFGVFAGAAEEEGARGAGVGILRRLLGFAAGQLLPEAHVPGSGSIAAMASIAKFSRVRAGSALMATRAQPAGHPHRE
jgi:hypothetical protein